MPQQWARAPKHPAPTAGAPEPVGLRGRARERGRRCCWHWARWTKVAKRKQQRRPLTGQTVGHERSELTSTCKSTDYSPQSGGAKRGSGRGAGRARGWVVKREKKEDGRHRNGATPRRGARGGGGAVVSRRRHHRGGALVKGRGRRQQRAQQHHHGGALVKGRGRRVHGRGGWSRGAAGVSSGRGGSRARALVKGRGRRVRGRGGWSRGAGGVSSGRGGSRAGTGSAAGAARVSEGRGGGQCPGGQQRAGVGCQVGRAARSRDGGSTTGARWVPALVIWDSFSSAAGGPARSMSGRLQVQGPALLRMRPARAACGRGKVWALRLRRQAAIFGRGRGGFGAGAGRVRGACRPGRAPRRQGV